MLRSIRIDDVLWEASSHDRRLDWRTTIVDLLDDGGVGDDHHTELRVGLQATDVWLELRSDDGHLDHHTLPSSAVASLIGEYLHIIRRMQDEEVADSSSKMQALDMAKKVVHDTGAKVLAGAAPGVASEHETYRRLFTLVLSVVVDVTALPGARAHRRHVTH